MFVIATIGCGISHKDTKRTDKCSNNKRQHRNKTTKTQTDTFQNTAKITKKNQTKVTYYFKGKRSSL
jgi:hypothetical protein